MNGFFLDVMGAPEINWGTNPIKIRTKTKVFQHGYYTEGEVIDETFMDVSSPQMLSEEEIKNKGFGQFAEGEVYECFSLTEIPLNKDSGQYHTVIFNNREYEVIKCSPFGVNYGTPEFDGSSFDGYFDIYFGRRGTTQGGMENAD